MWPRIRLLVASEETSAEVDALDMIVVMNGKEREKESSCSKCNQDSEEENEDKKKTKRKK
jgi:hypothetical protein